MATTRAPIDDATLITGLLARITSELGTMIGHELVVEAPAVERAHTRPAGKGQVHVSFKLALGRADGSKRFGALLVPLAEAITMASYLLMTPDDELPRRRAETQLDPALKDAMLELGSLIASACRTALAEIGAAGWSMSAEGCQGVRADVRPAFPYSEGSALAVGRARARLEPFEPFELLLILPALD